MLTLEQLKSIFKYDPDTGLFTYLVRRGPCKSGDIAGCYDHGYIRICIDGKGYYAHILAWFIVYGEFPEHLIDHEDGDKTNNKFKNLRKADKSSNAQNCKLHKDSSSGLKGVSRFRKKWRSYICLNGINKHLGIFSSAEEAHEAYCKEASKMFGEYARFE